MIDNEVNALGKDNLGNIWIGFDEGIAMLNPDSVVSVENRNPVVPPSDFMLFQNYPNPFNPTTTIKYSLAKEGFVKLDIYNILGQRVFELVNQQQKAGTYEVVFDASRLSSGVYFYKINSAYFSDTRKMLLIK